MKRHLLTAAAVSVLAMTAFAGAALAAETSADSLTQAERRGAWGFDLAGRDLTTAPGHD